MTKPWMTLQNNPAFDALLKRLRCYVVDWNPDYNGPTADHLEVTRIGAAEVTSSVLKDTGRGAADVLDPHHIVAIDLDIPAYLVPSTTEGHSHLYIDVPGGIPEGDYFDLLEVLARCGVIEEGYAAASVARKKTFLRLPWVKKPAAA